MNAKQMMMCAVFGATYAVAAATTWTVDKTSGNDEAAFADKTGATPFKSLQAAITNVNTKAGDTINVGPGDYGEEEGVVDDANGRSRIYVNKALRLVATSGPAETRIMGAVDPDTGSIGPNAVRCATAVGGTVFEGFTFRDGYSSDGETATVETRSGGVYTTGSNDAKRNVFLMNCVVSNCVSRNHGAVYFGTLLGCRVTHCRSTVNACAAQSSRAYFTLFDNNEGYTHVTYQISGHNCTFYNNTSVTGEDAKEGSLTNCLFSATKGVLESSLKDISHGNLVTDESGESMVDPANGDFRVRGAGVAFKTGDVSLLPAEIPLPDGYSSDDVKDPFGNPIDLEEFHAGAIQASVPYLRILDETGGLVIEGAAAGWNTGSDIESVVVSNRADLTRPCAGLIVNGVTNSYDDLPDRAFTLTAGELQSFGGCSIEAWYTGDWYVDPVDGDDLNSGFTPGHARRTLSAAMQGPVAGDTVHLAGGTYAEGDVMTAPVSETVNIRARVVVPEGVVLVGAGAGSTFISGAAASEEKDVKDGCGEDAVVAAFLNAGSRIERCTLRNGHTQLTGESNAWKNYTENIGGGAVALSANRSTARLVECVLSGNVAARGGGAANVTLVNCLVTDNSGLDGAAAAYEVNAYGTAFLRNTGSNWTVMYPYTLESCSIVSNVTSSASGLDLYATTQKPTFVNTVVDGNSSVSSGREVTLVSHCLFANDGKGDSACIDSALTDGTCLYRSAAEIVTDEKGRPVIGRNAGIGAADPDAYDFDVLGTKDLLGAPRVMNGAMDIGAFEADYRPVYFRNIGLARGEVTDVTGGVVDSDGATVLSDGDAIGFRWEHRTPGTCALVLTIAGEGTATVTRDGAVIGTLAGPAEKGTVTFNASVDADDIVVSFSGSGTLTFKAVDPVRGLVFICR